MFVRLLPEAGNADFLGAQDITCPRNKYSLPVEPGTAHLRVELPITEGIDALPWRNLDQVPVDEDGLDHDVTVVEGTGLGGSATLDGSPFEGAGLTLAYDFNSNFGAGFAASGPDGAWMDFFGRSPFTVQTGVRYQAFCDLLLGTLLAGGQPSGGFLFPSQTSVVDCAMETAPADKFTHKANPLVVTPMPGDIGGNVSGEFFGQYGVGWGVQFPVPPGSSPSHDGAASEFFLGGLMVGLSPDRVLSGVDATGEMECGATCRDLGLNGRVKFTTESGGRKTVTWRYSDATSAEAVGLEVTQVSTDGKNSNEYVLFENVLRNVSRSTLTLHAGFWGDLDVEFDPFDDQGFTDLDGKLMYQVSASETGVHVGTMLLGAPITGNYFFTGLDFPTPSDQVQALNGGLKQETAGPADLRYIQGAGPITLKRGERRTIWIAVVAGETKDQLLANAAAAEADVASRLNQPLATSTTSTIMEAPAARPASRALARPICKNCKPQ